MSVSHSVEKSRGSGVIDSSLEFLPAALEIIETPPRPLGRALAITIGTFFVLMIAWAGLSPIDIVAVADGRVVPNGQIKVVQPFQAGVVTAIHVSEGDYVEAGDIMIELDDTEAVVGRARVELELARAEHDQAVALALLAEDPPAAFTAPVNSDANMGDLAATVLEERWRGYQSALAENQAERLRIESLIESLETEEASHGETLAELESLLESTEALNARGLALRSQVINIRLQIIATRQQQQAASNGIAQASLDRERNEAQRRQTQSEFVQQANSELADSYLAVLTGRKELERLREREALYTLRSPTSGTVNEVMVHTLGGVVTPSERLLTIVPSDAEMVVEAQLPNRDVGFVEVGQPAEIKLEAFPFTHYGVVHGQVVHISPDSVTEEGKEPTYTVLIAPNGEEFSAGSETVRLSPGMRATAEVKTGFRTVLEYFLAPIIRYRDEAIRER